MSKLIEKAWTRQIEAHMRKNKIIDSNHQGRVKKQKLNKYSNANTPNTDKTKSKKKHHNSSSST